MPRLVLLTLLLGMLAIGALAPNQQHVHSDNNSPEAAGDADPRSSESSDIASDGLAVTRMRSSTRATNRSPRAPMTFGTRRPPLRLRDQLVAARGRRLPSPPRDSFFAAPSPIFCVELIKMMMRTCELLACHAVCDLPRTMASTQHVVHHTFDASIEELHHGDWKSALSNACSVATAGGKRAIIDCAKGCGSAVLSAGLACSFVAATGFIISTMPVHVLFWLLGHVCDSKQRTPDKSNDKHSHPRPTDAQAKTCFAEWVKELRRLPREEQEFLKEIGKSFQCMVQLRDDTFNDIDRQREALEGNLQRHFPRFYDWD